jgi:hypothetical protein
VLGPRQRIEQQRVLPAHEFELLVHARRIERVVRRVETEYEQPT